MPPRNPELPEGTDHIINGAMETGAGTGASTGSSGGSGFIGGGGGDDTGGSTMGGTAGLGGGMAGAGAGGGGFSGSTGGLSGTSGLGASGGATGGLASGGGFSDTMERSDMGGSDTGGGAKDQLKSGAQKVRQQATGKVRDYAEQGKDKATGALDEFSNVVRDAAGQIDEKLGAEYGQYARKAADSVASFSQSLRDKQVDELYEDARAFVRKSPAVAIGTAAAIGFALVRLIKAGAPDTSERDVDFTPDASLGGPTSGSTAGSTTVASDAPYVAPGGGAGI